MMIQDKLQAAIDELRCLVRRDQPMTRSEVSNVVDSLCDLRTMLSPEDDIPAPMVLEKIERLIPNGFMPTIGTVNQNRVAAVQAMVAALDNARELSRQAVTALHDIAHALPDAARPNIGEELSKALPSAVARFVLSVVPRAEAPELGDAARPGWLRDVRSAFDRGAKPSAAAMMADEMAQEEARRFVPLSKSPHPETAAYDALRVVAMELGCEPGMSVTERLRVILVEIERLKRFETANEPVPEEHRVPMSEIDTTNRFGVGATNFGRSIRVLANSNAISNAITPSDAINLAAWLVALATPMLADDAPHFQDVLDAVRST